MRLTRLLLPMLAAISFVASAEEGATAQKGEKDADRAVRYTALLETDPLGGEASGMRSWLMQWVIDTPDYSVTACNVFGPVMEDDSAPNGPELVSQQMFGNVSYQIKHPGTVDQLTLQLAGMESVLKAYSSILAKNPKAHIAYFDNLLEKQAKGTLKESLTPVILKNCGGTSA